VRFQGEAKSGEFVGVRVGVELDTPTGKNDGRINGEMLEHSSDPLNIHGSACSSSSAVHCPTPALNPIGSTFNVAPAAIRAAQAWHALSLKH
jgi:hypothetical protein